MNRTLFHEKLRKLGCNSREINQIDHLSYELINAELVDFARIIRQLEGLAPDEFKKHILEAVTTIEEGAADEMGMEV